MFMSRRKAIAGILATGAGLSINFATVPLSFASSLATSAGNPTALKMKATIKNSQITLKKSKLAGKNAKAPLKSYIPKTNKQAAPLAAADTASFTEFPVTTTSNPKLGKMVKGDDGSSFFFVEQKANRIGKITTQGAITEYLLPSEQNGYDLRGIANGPDDSFWFTYSSPRDTAYIGRLVSGSGQITLYTVGSAEDDLNLIDITRGPHDPLWFIGSGFVGCIHPDGEYTIFHIDAIGTTYRIVAANDGALWFTYEGHIDDTYGVARISTDGEDLTYYQVPERVRDIVAGDGNDLWFVPEDGQSVYRITTSGQLTRYSLANVSSAIGTPSPRTIARVASGTYAFAARATYVSDPYKYETYMATITTTGDVQLYQQPKSLDLPQYSLYAGWANEVWSTTLTEVYKFRLNS